MTNRTFDFKAVEKALEGEDSYKVDSLKGHIENLRDAKNKSGDYICKWLSFLKPEQVVVLYKRAINHNLFIDGKNVVIENRGGKIQLSYSYIAYKNKLLGIYPEAKIDFGVVYKGDDFSIAKENGNVFYSYKANDPFNNNDDLVIGVYCIIKIGTGDFFITLDRKELNQLRKKATTDNIWSDWFKDMCIKSAIKKLVSKHFEDTYRDLNEEDNQTISIENPLDIELELKREIEAIETEIGLREFHHLRIGEVKNKLSFKKMLRIRADFITERDSKIVSEFSQLVEIKDPDNKESLIEDFKKQPQDKKLEIFENLKSK